MNIKGYESDLEDELIEMHVDLATNSSRTILTCIRTSYMAEAGLSHVNAILTKQKKRLNLQNRGNLRLKLTMFQPIINNLAAVHQSHPPH